jgi:hypothetical protein
LREASSGTTIYPEHVLEEMLLRDNPFDIKNRSFAVGSETTYTQEWGRRRSVVSVANQTAAARGPRDLERHACLGYSYLATGERWHFTNAEGVEEAVTVRGPLSATNAEALEGSSPC